MGKVYISCRRGDDSAVAGELRECLEDELGGAGLFLDAQDLPADADFIPSVIEARVAECDVLLALISQTWQEAPDGHGERLLDSPDDPVRIEIASALEQGKRVIPVLVNDAQMPGAESLPGALKPLTYCSPVRLSHEHAAAGVEELITALRVALAEDGAGPRARASRENISTANSEDAGDWPTLAELNEAIGPAEWDVAAGQQDARRPVPFPVRPRGSAASRSQTAEVVEPLFPPATAAQGEIASWRVFLSDFPDDIDVEEARTRLQALEHEAEAVWSAEAGELTETKAWAKATSSGSIDEIKAFLDKWPDGQYAGEAREWLHALEAAIKAAWTAETRKVAEKRAWERVARTGNIAEIKAFLNEWPTGEHATAARARLQTLESEARAAWEAKARKVSETKAWESAWRSGDIVELKAFLKEWPESEFAGEARAQIAELRGPFVTRRGVLAGLGAGATVAVAGGATAIMYTGEETSGEPAQRPFINDRPILTLTGHAAWIHSVAFSPDGSTILSGSGDNVLKLWDIAGGKELKSFKGFPDGLRTAAFSPDGQAILCGGNGGRLILLDAVTGKVLRSFKGHSDGIPSVAFSPDGRRALSGSWDKTLRLWDVAKGVALRTFRGHSGEINVVAFSPEGDTILSGSRDRTLLLWDVDTGRVLRTFQGHTDWISAAVFSPGGRAVLSSSTDNTLRLWDVDTGQELRVLPGQARDYSPVTFSPDGRAILAGGYATLKLWDAVTGKELGTFTGHESGVTSVVISPDGSTAASGSMDKTLKLWDLASSLSVSALR